MIVIAILFSFCLAWLLVWMLVIVKRLLDLAVCCLRRKPHVKPHMSARHFKIERRILTVGVAALIFALTFSFFLMPQEEKTFLSPDGQYELTIRFYIDAVWGEKYDVLIILRNSLTGETLAQVEDSMRGVFVDPLGTGILWDLCVRVEWNPHMGASDIVRVLFPEMNTAILMPSATWVFPLTELDLLDTPDENEAENLQ